MCDHCLETTLVTLFFPIHYHFMHLYGHPSQPLGMYRNCPVTVGGNIICIDIEVLNAPLDYNILLGHSNTYTISAILSVIHNNMCFPHNGNILIFDQLTYYDPKFETTHQSTISSMT